MAGKYGHKLKKLLEKKAMNVEELPAAYCTTITNTTCQMMYEWKDCGEKWSETK